MEIRKQSAIGAVSEREVRERTLEVFSSSYMTLVSIIQGGAITFLVSKSLEAHQGSGLSVGTGVRVAATTLTVLVVFYMYSWYTVFVRYVPSIVDSAIPLALGGSEIAMALSLGEPSSWLTWSLITAVFGAAAFANSLLRATPDMFPRADAIAGKIWSILLLMACLAALLAIAACGLRLVAIVGPRAEGASVILGLATCIGVVMMIVISEYLLRDVYRIYGHRRFDFDFANFRRAWKELRK